MGFQKGHKINLGRKGKATSGSFKKGHFVSEKTKRKAVETRMKNGSYIAWNKGTKKKFYCMDCGKEISSYNINCIKCAGLKRKGVSPTEKSIEKNRLAHLGRKNPKTKEAIINQRKSLINFYKTKEGFKKRERASKRFKKIRKTFTIPVKDTSIEIKIQNFLKQLGISFFTHQYMKIRHGYQCDILIPIMNLVIETDGNYWHKYPVGLEKDHIRTQELIEKGFKVLRLWEYEIKDMDLNNFKERLNEI